MDDDPSIGAKAFLYACMRDRSLPLARRVEAAGYLMRIEPNGPPSELTIKILGRADPSAHYSDDPRLDDFCDWQAKGHA